MTPQGTKIFIIASSILLVSGVIGVALVPQTHYSVMTNSSAVLSIVTATAVGIERTLEGFWTFIGLTKGSFWPLNQLSNQVNTLVSNLDTNLDPFYKNAKTAIGNVVGRAPGDIQAAQADIDEVRNTLNAQITKLQNLPTDNQQVQMITGIASQTVKLLQEKYPEIQAVASAANEAIKGVNDFVATFKDNPGRRLISLYAGAIIGLGVAAMLNLDAFHAALNENSKISGLGVAFTGVLMGLGSNPTHEVIRAIQEVKKGYKADNSRA